MKASAIVATVFLLICSVAAVAWGGSADETAGGAPPGGPAVTAVQLRAAPGVVSEDDLKRCLVNHNFFDQIYNNQGQFVNDFVDNGDGTVTDRATGLMWQQAGSKTNLIFKRADQIIYFINSSRLGGYSDWRLPTIEELMSLMKPKFHLQDTYINRVFSLDQISCWSPDNDGGKFNWVANFGSGRAEKDDVTLWYTGRKHFVRAVRNAR